MDAGAVLPAMLVECLVLDAAVQVVLGEVALLLDGVVLEAAGDVVPV